MCYCVCCCWDVEDWCCCWRCSYFCPWFWRVFQLGGHSRLGAWKGEWVSPHRLIPIFASINRLSHIHCGANGTTVVATQTRSSNYFIAVAEIAAVKVHHVWACSLSMMGLVRLRTYPFFNLAYGRLKLATGSCLGIAPSLLVAHGISLLRVRLIASCAVRSPSVNYRHDPTGQHEKGSW